MAFHCRLFTVTCVEFDVDTNRDWCFGRQKDFLLRLYRFLERVLALLIKLDNFAMKHFNDFKSSLARSGLHFLCGHHVLL